MLLKRLARRAAAIVIVCLIGTHDSYVAAGLPPTNGTSQLGGWVYIDRNNDGVINFATHATPEWMIGGVLIELYSLDNPSLPPQTTQTSPNGRYIFDDLAPGSYRLKEIQPVQYVDGIHTLGEVFGSPAALVGAFDGEISGNDEFSNIELTANTIGNYYNFGERGWALGYASKRFLEGYEPIMQFGNDEPAFVIPEPATPVLLATLMTIGLLPRRRRGIS